MRIVYFYNLSRQHFYAHSHDFFQRKITFLQTDNNIKANVANDVTLK